MPPRRAVPKRQRRFVEAEAEETLSNESESETEQQQDFRQTPQDEEDDDDDEEEDDNRKSKTQKGIKKSEIKKWRRLAIEEKEALVNEGGIVWRAAQPILSTLPSRAKVEMTSLLRSALQKTEENLNDVLVPPTARMPHASRNVGIGAGLSSTATGSIAGSVMSWQVERGERLDGQEESEERDEVALLELGGFSSDIAVLESLLLPEATETVSMLRAIEVQEQEIEVSRGQLMRLKADRESRKRHGNNAGSELQSRLKRAKETLDDAGATSLHLTEAIAIRDAATRL